MRYEGLPDLPDAVTVHIEVSRGCFVKRRPDGRIDLVSPLPCPYNYGSIEGTRAADGDPIDALVLGPKLGFGVRCVVPVRGAIDFVDDGTPDPKVVCSIAPLSDAQRRGVEAFFCAYTWLKRGLYLTRGRHGPTRTRGWLPPV